MPEGLHLLPISMSDAITGLLAVVRESSQGNGVEFTVGSAIAGVTLSKAVSGSSPETDGEIRQILEEVKDLPELYCQSAYVRFNGSQGSQPYSLRFASDKDGTRFTLEQAPNRETSLRVARSLKSHFKIIPRQAVLGASLPQDAQDALRFKEQAVGEIASQVSRLGVFLTQMAENTAKQNATQSAELDRRYLERSTQLDEQHAARLKELEDRQAKLDEQKKKLDDRERIHVRRDLMEKMAENLKAREQLVSSLGKASSRLGVHLLTGVVAVLAIALAIFGAHELYKTFGQSPFDWRPAAPFTSGSILFIGTIIFYFRWTSHWSDRLAEHHFNSIQYASDILRANWIAEFLFEYKKESVDKEVPAEIVESFTRGLFRSEEGRRRNYHPADDLLGLIKKVREVEVSPDTIRVRSQGKK